jgi:hypothetical protein
MHLDQLHMNGRQAVYSLQSLDSNKAYVLYKSSVACRREMKADSSIPYHATLCIGKSPVECEACEHAGPAGVMLLYIYNCWRTSLRNGVAVVN